MKGNLCKTYGYVCVLVTQSCLTLPPHGPQPTRLLCPWNPPGKNIGVDCNFVLQNIWIKINNY